MAICLWHLGTFPAFAKATKISLWEVCESCIFHSGFMSVGAFYFETRVPWICLWKPRGGHGHVLPGSCCVCCCLEGLSTCRAPRRGCHVLQFLFWHPPLSFPTSHLHKWLLISWIIICFNELEKSVYICSVTSLTRWTLFLPNICFVYICTINYLCRLLLSWNQP